MSILKNMVQIDKRKGIAGIVLAVLAMTVCGVLGAWARCIAYGLLFTVVGYIRLNIKRDTAKYLMYLLWVFAVAEVTLSMPALMVNGMNAMMVTSSKLMLNLLCILIVWGAMYVIIAKPVVSVVAGSFLLLLLATVNGVIYQFRGKEMGYMDILSIKTAISVAKNYNFRFFPAMAYGWLFWMFFAFSGFSLAPLPYIKKLHGRLIALGAEAALIMVLWLGSANIPIRTWDNEGTRINGYYLNFYLGIRDSDIEKPKNYNVADIEKQAQKYKVSDNGEEIESMPNVIVIMDESYADFRVFGNLQTNKQVTPFLDSLSENTVRGYALTSVYGGNTANVEFEFLTGSSMSFLPDGSVPYQQYINKNTYTLARLMSSYGYKSAATHPYWRSGWSRDIIYPYFGFEESTFIDEYSVDRLVRDYVGDRDMFEYVIKMLENKTEDKPLFLFGITMQNHGGYDYIGEDFINTIKLEGYSGEYPMAEQYLSLIHETDLAMEYLLTSLKDYPEDTVVLFFGDHFPSVESDFYKELYGREFDTISDRIWQYKVPFIIWANYDIPEKNIELTSVNFLAKHLLETAGLPLSPYHSFLADVEKVVPAMNASGYYSTAHDEFVSYDKAAGEEAEWIERYSALQYNSMFDKKNRNEIFFGKQ